jgi:eukaryotic-like serine/threonine-protein kinase
MVSVNTTDPMIGRLVDGRYQVRSRIARGGMATVYVATDLRLERRVAIKIMHGHLADDSKFRERFIQEARSAARLAHPNVVNVFDQGQDPEMAYLVMEYLSGITLRDLLQERKSLTPTETLDILSSVLAGLAAAHKAGIVHRDLKPENVLLADDGRIKIGDFGLARAASANTATGAALLGTIAYLSPELVTRGIADTRSDIYAVGIMMYEMLVGEQPFKGDEPMQIAYQHANGTVPMPSSKNPRIPAELDELVLWATAREPDQRPHDARVLLEQLVETQDQLRTALPMGPTSGQRTVVMPEVQQNSEAETQILAPRPNPAVGAVALDATATLQLKAVKRRKKGRWLFALVLLLAGLAAGTGWYFGNGPGSLVTIPSSIVGLKPDAASSLLSHLGLVTSDTTVSVFDPTVAAGLVAGTSPKVGAGVVKDGTITLQISQGPKPVAVPTIIGVSEDTAIANIKAAGLVLDTKNRAEQFSDTVATGVVIGALGVDSDGKKIALKNGDGYFDQRKVSLVVSVGAVPLIAGKSFDDAVAILKDKNLTGVVGTPEFSDDIPKDAAIRVDPKVAGAAIAPGDTVFIVMSNGQDLVAIPDVVGKSVNNAMKLLKAAGFTVKVDSNLGSKFWDVQTVDSFSPGEPGGSLKRGTEITIKARD